VSHPFVGTDFQGVFENGYGHRARIGHLNPCLVDETVGAQFYRMAPLGVTLVQTSLQVDELTERGIMAAIDRAENAAIALAKEAPDCIIVGGSPTAVVGGFGSDQRLCERLEQVTGIPTTSSQAAAIEAMRLLGMKRVVIATPQPFDEGWNRRLTEFLEASGFTVVRIGNLPADSRGHLGYVEQTPPQLEYELVLRTFREAGEDVDGIYLPGAPSPVVDLIEVVERELGTTVVSSGQAALWKGMRMAGCDGTVSGYGKLLRTPWAEASG
jgi:maleate cis-trans isomerase